ncbi:Crp/Fnr family transcriptional regulator [Deinococcus yavapaiensis]|uniref:CRP-like cAMP-binding protein n=1 Tax=Deinococcus yavapaiensis KR-236 TaxID=694435 RepID=A0A318S6K3_9DEIO|nr:Crp/Fnr family transcriptional regulator [Deinococcus yavapaiensis]PYE53347.1 CRP-like cAMP-binding protein [Deinococcus yavapaiensis KR-236]
MAVRDALLRSPLFQDAPTRILDFAVRAVVERTYEAHEAIVTQDTQGEALYFLQEGRARVLRESATGRERIVGFLYSGDVFGEGAALGGPGRGATVVAETTVRALVMYRSELSTLFERHPKMLWNLARLLARRVDALNEELIAMSLDSEASMAHLLLKVYRQRGAAGEGDAAFLPLTSPDLTACLGTSRETTARTLKKFTSRKLVKVEGGGLRLLDVDGIERTLYDND